MFRSLAAAVFLAATAAPAQVTSYETNRPAPVKGDADKIVCKKWEKLGSRLAAKKVCLTVREWTARANNDRDETGRIQSGTKVCQTVACD